VWAEVAEEDGEAHGEDDAEEESAAEEEVVCEIRDPRATTRHHQQRRLIDQPLRIREVSYSDDQRNSMSTCERALATTEARNKSARL
jgi:hypothetical protein